MKTKEEVRAIVKSMTMDEKIRCCALYEDRFGNLPRLGIKYRSCDNPSGGWNDYFRVDRSTMGDEFWGTCFPQASASGCTWNPELVQEIGTAMGKECKNQDIDILLRPGVNMKRSPLGGRNFEYYSEDPVLAAEMGAAFINGVQSQQVAANLKHFVCNNQEYERMTTNAVVDERTLNEMYLRVFQLILEKSDPWTIMTSYNKVNGKWVPQNPYIMNKLRKEWGYDGLVMSDAFAVHYKEDKTEDHKLGLDVELAEESNHVDILKAAINNGEIMESELDLIAEHVVECYYKIHDGHEVKELDLAAHHALAKRAAIEGAVLLENDGVLPLDAENMPKLAIIGAFAKDPCYMGGGSGHMNGHTLDIPSEQIEKYIGKNYTYAPGYQINAGFPPADTERADLVAEAKETAKNADLILMFLGYPYGVESEGYDRTDLFLPKSQRDMIDAVLSENENVIMVISTGAPIDLRAYKDHVKAILQTGYAGEASGSAVADILFGTCEAGGRLAETYPVRVEDTPAYLSLPSYPDTVPNVVYGEGVYIGYRWYDARNMAVAYPFGYGLSYTSFEYSNLNLSKSCMKADEEVVVSFDVTNTGDRAGSDVPQLYVRDVISSMNRPVRELAGFKKVYLEAGETKHVEITLNRKVFEFYSPALHTWVLEGGDFEIELGKNIRDLKLSKTLQIISKEKVKKFSPNTQIGHFTKEPMFREILKDYPERIQEFFDVDTNPVLPLAMAIPFIQFCEMDLGQGEMNRKWITEICDKLNLLN